MPWQPQLTNTRPYILLRERKKERKQRGKNEKSEGVGEGRQVRSEESDMEIRKDRSFSKDEMV